MNDSLQSAPKPNGLATALNTILAPKEAFESIRVAPTWGIAFVIVELLVLAGSMMILPAIRHGFDNTWAMQVATNPRMAQMSADQLAMAKSVSMMIVNLSPIFALVVVPISFLISTILMLIFNAIGRGSANFTNLWAVAVNIGIPVSIGSVVTGIIALVRGAESFNTAQSVQQAMPSLALIVPGGNPHLVAFLSQINPFTVWAAALVVLAMLVVARVSHVPAWLTGIIAFLLPALIASAFVR